MDEVEAVEWADEDEGSRDIEEEEGIAGEVWEGTEVEEEERQPPREMRRFRPPSVEGLEDPCFGLPLRSDAPLPVRLEVLKRPSPPPRSTRLGGGLYSIASEEAYDGYASSPVSIVAGVVGVVSVGVAVSDDKRDEAEEYELEPEGRERESRDVTFSGLTYCIAPPSLSPVRSSTFREAIATDIRSPLPSESSTGQAASGRAEDEEGKGWEKGSERKG